MKKLLLLTMLAAVLAGCKSKEMKSTPLYEGTDVKYVGDPRERVNLWPIAYWHNPVGSVVWPVVSFSDDLFALRPLYSQYKQDGASGAYDEFNFLWPIAQADTKHNDYRFFPFFWGESGTKGEYYQAVFPLYFNGPNYNALLPLWCYHAKSDRWTFSTLAGLAGARKDKSERYRASWCFPLWYENSEGVLATTLFGYGKDSMWVFPIGYWDENSFMSLLYSQGHYGKSDDTWWSVPLTLSWGSWARGEDGDSHSSKGKILLGLFGWDRYEWKSKRKNVSYQRHEWWCGPLMGYEGWTDSSETWFLLHFAEHSTRDGKAVESYFFPLYWWARDSGCMTPLGGWDHTTYYLTPLVGINRAESKLAGGYVFPIWFYEKSRDFEEKIALMEAEKLPDSIEVYESPRTNDVGEVKTRLHVHGTYAGDNTTWFLLSDHNRSFGISDMNFCRDENFKCNMWASHKFGNRLLLNSKGKRTVTFDLATREKLADKEEDESSFLCFLYTSESSRDRMKGETYARHRVLWKLWDYEERNGKVTLDVFPGLTYDKDTDGNSKTSFLWRLYNYERTSAGGTNLDLLFIPILRAK